MIKIRMIEFRVCSKGYLKWKKSFISRMISFGNFRYYLSQELTGEIMTIAQQWEQEGIKKGMAIAHQWKEEALREGRQEGEAILLKRQLMRRFGNIPSHYEKRINYSDSETLLLWGEKILEAKTIEDVFE